VYLLFRFKQQYQKAREKLMKTIRLRPVEPERDFGQIAAMISSQEDEPTTEAGLKEDYAKHREWLVRIMAAEDQHGELLGFYWAWRDRPEPQRVSFILVVKPERRRLGAGRQLYEDLAQTVKEAKAEKLRVSVRDTFPEGRAFVERRGFRENRHTIGMELDLAAFDDRLYDAIISRLKGEGFQFTSMEELGNTEEAQRRLYALNDAASASTPGQGGEHAWASFEDFQKSVCQSDWYKPAGQFVAIDTATGAWAAMSAITRMQGQLYAYNRFTGVDLPYRGRKLGQAVKVLALRYARSILKADIVRTHHNTRNLPMIAIDRKFGYRQLPGSFLMDKDLA
jgi:GNAT superfamily N-acetyltransferase